MNETPDETPPLTRLDDPPDGRDRVLAARREGRARTLFYSALVAGLVALVIVRLSEVETDNDQIDRSRVNCRLIQDDRRDRAETLNNEADRVLGNQKHVDENGNPDPIPPLNFKGSGFEQYRPLIVANAKQSRTRARVILARIENCNRVFPKRKTWFIF